jgi:hypothetical protein
MFTRSDVVFTANGTMLQNVDIVFPSIPLQSYVLSGLTSYTQYELRVRAANVLNDVILWGNATNFVYVTTDAERTNTLVPL